MIYNIVRQIYEKEYCDTCTIVEKVKNRVDGVTSFSEKETVLNQACKISFENIPSTAESNTKTSIVQSIKLFLAPEIEVKPGSKIDVTHLGVTTSYKRSGSPAVHPTHQEVMLELWKENA